MSSSVATEKIEQLVFDENKIVTYKLLSNELSVHVNKAKQLLNEYITNHHNKGKNDLNVYYAISGFQKYNGHKVHKLAVVSKDELEAIKEGFSSLSSVHIYSIQKCSSLDECSLFTSDYLLTNSSDDPNEFSAIKHPDLKIRENRVVKNVESKSDKSRTVQPQTIKKTEAKLSVPARKTNSLFTTWQKKEEQKDKATKEQNDSPPASSKNTNSVAEKKSDSSPQKVSKVANKEGKNNIMSLFSKQAVKSASKPNSQNSEKSISQSSILSESVKEEQEVRITEEEEETKRTEAKARQVGATSKKETSRKKRQKQKKTHDISDNESDGEWEKPKKKRKRIVAAFSDSDSESEEEEKKDRAQRNLMDSDSPAKAENNLIDSEDEAIPPTPDEEAPIPRAVLSSATNGKRKKLKIVNKTFEDEDGFLVTQKVKEYVTDSENSDNETTAKAAPKALPKPDIKKNFVNKKQSSLMSFFKQK